MNKSPVKILISAISGYGYYYLKTLLEEVPEDRAIICGIIDPEPEKSGYFQEMVARNVPVYADMESFFADGNQADLTVISSPLHFHASQSVIALNHGSNVLVDKPVGVTVAEVEELIVASRRTHKWVEVGYQWSFSAPIRQLKKDILAGRFGKPLQMKTICLWPRPYDYFHRNGWAGRIRTAEGRMVLDSIANNACAHFLHNMFFLTGREMHRSSVPVRVSAQRFRAYDIENFDTVICRATTDLGVDIGFYASHVTQKTVNPTFEFRFEKAVVRLNEELRGIEARMDDGTVIDYGHPDGDHQFGKLFRSINRCRAQRDPVCPPEAALSQTICINQIHGLPDPILTFEPDSFVECPGRRYVKGLGERMMEAYRIMDDKIVTRFRLPFTS
jgi:predicted dehydrogenase